MLTCYMISSVRSIGFVMKSLFESGVRENLKFCAVQNASKYAVGMDIKHQSYCGNKRLGFIYRMPIVLSRRHFSSKRYNQPSALQQSLQKRRNRAIVPISEINGMLMISCVSLKNITISIGYLIGLFTKLSFLMYSRRKPGDKVTWTYG